MNGTDHEEIYHRIGATEQEQARVGEKLRAHEDAINATTRNVLSLGRDVSDHETRVTVMESQMREIRIVGRLIVGLLLSAVILQVLAMAGIVGAS